MSYSPNRPKRLRTNATGGASLSGSTWNKIVCDAPSVNTAGFTESSDVFTCTIPGVYLASLRMPTALSGVVANASIYKNGVIVANLILGSSLSTGNNIGYALSFFAPIELAVGDTVAFYCYPVSGVTLGATSLERFIELELIS